MKKNDEENYISVNTAIILMITTSILVFFLGYIVLEQHLTIAEMNTQIATSKKPVLETKYILVKEVKNDIHLENKSSRNDDATELKNVFAQIDRNNIDEIKAVRLLLAQLNTDLDGGQNTQYQVPE